MPENELNALIARKISEFLVRTGKSQLELAEYLGVTQATVSYWCNGRKIPRMDKIDEICSFFHCNRSDLMEDKPHQEHYYMNPETQKIAQDIFENKELRLLFSDARDASPEDLKATHDILLALKRKERGSN